MNLEEKIKNDLERQGVSVTPTSVVHDLFIRKFVQLHEPFESEFASYMSRMDFLNFGAMTHDDLVKFSGNFFVSPRGGSRASGDVRLYYSLPTAVNVPQGTVFLTEDGKRFLSDQDQSITADEMISQIDGIYYFMDVSVVAEGDGSDYNVEPGMINQCDNLVISSATVKISNPLHFLSGSNPESPEELFNRTKESITVHSFANNKSIRKVIKETFPDVTKIYVVRAKSEEMLRDRLMVNIDGVEVEVRVGNMVDVYVDSLQTSTMRTVVYNHGQNEIPFGFGALDFEDNPMAAVVFRVLSVRLSDALGQTVGDEIAPDGWNFTQDPKTSNSVKQTGVLTITDPDYTDSAQYFEVEYIGSVHVPIIQNLMWSDEERMPVGDYLARGFSLSFLSGVIRYKGAVDEEVMQELIETRLLRHDEKSIEVSDIVEFMYQQGATKVTLPITLSVQRDTGEIIEFNNKYDLDNKETFIPRGFVVVKEG